MKCCSTKEAIWSCRADANLIRLVSSGLPCSHCSHCSPCSHCCSYCFNKVHLPLFPKHIHIQVFNPRLTSVVWEPAREKWFGPAYYIPGLSGPVYYCISLSSQSSQGRLSPRALKLFGDFIDNLRFKPTFHPLRFLLHLSTSSPTSSMYTFRRSTSTKAISFSS